MDKLNDILNNIKERFSNPLIFSFICSWLIINWQITVGLLWFDSKQFEKEGYVSIFAFINNKLNPSDSFWVPLSAALIYTFSIPLIKNVIRAFYSWTSKWGDSWNFKILGKGKISIDKYLKLRAEYEKRSTILEDVITKESAYIENYNLIQTDLLQTKNTLNEAAQKLNINDTFIRQLQDSAILNGSWQNSYESPDGIKGMESIYIENHKYYVISPQGEKEHKFDIRNFFYDNRNGNIFFVKEVVSEEKSIRAKTEHHNINRLIFENKDLLQGTENGTTKIVYTRI